MAEPLESPFKNYVPPKGSEVFSAWGKREIVKFKSKLITLRVSRELSQDVDSDDFFNGLCGYEIQYDCRSLEPFITFANRTVELDFIVRSVVLGLRLAKNKVSDNMLDTDPEVSKPLMVSAGYDKVEPRLANIAMRFCL